MLIVIEDAWQIEDALACKVGGAHCTYVLTTRFPSLALHFAHHQEELTVHELEKERGGAGLLAQLVPTTVQHEARARHLIKCVGGLPLALMGKHLLLQSYSGQSRCMHAACIHRPKTS